MNEINVEYKFKYAWVGWIFLVPFGVSIIFELFRTTEEKILLYNSIFGFTFGLMLYLGAKTSKLQVTSEYLSFQGLFIKTKKFKISDFSEIRTVANSPSLVSIYDLKGKKIIHDVSRFFSSNEELREFVDLLLQINPNIIDDVKFDGIKGLMLYGKTKFKN